MKNLEFNRNITTTVWAKQGDSGRVLEFTCTKDLRAMDLTGKTVKFNMKEPNIVYINCSVINALQGIINVPLTNTVLAEAGQYYADISITDTASKVISSATILLEISETQTDAEAIEASDEYNALTQTMADYTNMKNMFQDAMDAVSEGETVRVNLVQAVTNAGTAKEELVTATTAGNKTKTALEGATSTANVAKTALEVVTATGNTAKEELEAVLSDTKLCEDYNGVVHETFKERLNTDFTNVYDRFNQANYIPYNTACVMAQDSYVGNTADIVIMGKTLKNVIPRLSTCTLSHVDYKAKDNTLTMTNNTTDGEYIGVVYSDCKFIKPSTKYTIFYEIVRVDDDGDTWELTMKGGGNDYIIDTPLSMGKTKGFYSKTFKTRETLSATPKISFCIANTALERTIVLRDTVMIVEGDYTGQPYPPYTLGITSVGENEKDDDGKYPITVNSIGSNLIDKTDFYYGESLSGCAKISSFAKPTLPYTPDEEKDGVAYVVKNKAKGVKYKFKVFNANTNIMLRMSEYANSSAALDADNVLTKSTYNTDGDYAELTSISDNSIIVCAMIGKWTNGSTTIHTVTESENPMLVCGDLPIKKYIEYDNHVQTVLLNDPLKGLPNGVCDSIENGKLIRRVGVKTFDGSEDERWTVTDGSEDGTKRRFKLNVSDMPESDTGINNSMCNRLNLTEKFGTFDKFLNAYTIYDNKLCVSDNSWHQNDNKTDAQRLETFKADLADNPIIIYYELDTPVETDIAFTELRTYDGQTIIASGNVLSSGISCSVPTNVQARISTLLTENANLLNTNTTLKEKAERLKTENIEQQTQINDLSDITDFLIASSL